MESPLVSIIVPTYNRVDYLEKTLASIIAQTYTPIEIIVVDDGSPNNDTEMLCNALDVTYLKIPNSGGPATPRNKGFEIASGDFIAFLDDDDLWLPHKIETQVAILKKNKNFGIVHGPCKIIDEHDVETGEIIGKHRDAHLKHGDVRNRMMGRFTLMMPTPLIRRTILERVGVFNEKIPAALEDVEFWNRCSFKTKFYYHPEILVLYRKHANNISSKNKNYAHLPLYLREVMKEAYAENEIDDETQNKLKSNILSLQAKYIKANTLLTLKNFFLIDPFWFCNISVVKIVVANLARK